MKTLTVSVTKIPPSKLFLLRWICSLIGATIVVCKAKPRRVKEHEANDPGMN